MQRQFSAGGVVYRIVEGRVLWLVRKSKCTGGYYQGGWSLPKGWLDDEEGGKGPGPKTLGKQRATQEEIEAAALREVREEGGVIAKIIKRVGEEKYSFINEKMEKVFKIVTFYLMEYIKDAPEGFGEETEEVRWVEAAEAEQLLNKRSGERNVIQRARLEV